MMYVFFANRVAGKIILDLVRVVDKFGKAIFECFVGNEKTLDLLFSCNV